MSKRVEQYFTKTADRFDRLYELPVAQQWFNRVFRRAIYQRFDLTFKQAGDVRDKRVLDVGCGSGRYALEFARRGASEVVGVDFAEDMLEIARAYVRRQRYEDRVHFERVDFSAFTPERSFDVVVAIGFFDYLADPAVTLARMRALTSGRLLASFPANTFPRAFLRRLRYARHGVRLRFYSRREVAQLATGAGFVNVAVLPLSAGHFLVADASINS